MPLLEVTFPEFTTGQYFVIRSKRELNYAKACLSINYLLYSYNLGIGLVEQIAHMLDAIHLQNCYKMLVLSALLLLNYNKYS